MPSSRMGSTPRGAANSASSPGLDGLVDKSLLQSRARNSRAEGSVWVQMAECFLGLNSGSVAAQPLEGRMRALLTAREEAESNDGARQGYTGDSCCTSPGMDTAGKPAAEPQSKPRFAARTCSCRSPSAGHCCRGSSSQGSVLEIPPVHRDAFLVP